MDPDLVASMRKDLETKSTEELRQVFETQDRATWAPEALEAMRQILEERRTNSNRFVFAMGGAILLGAAGGAGAWWQGLPEVMAFVVGVVCAILGAVSFYIPGLFAPS